MTPSRLYSWDAIVNRNFVRDSLKAVLPDKIKEINELVDVGEYGIESYWCRLACCFIFMMSCMGELEITFKMFQLLYKIPTNNDPWIKAKPNEKPETHLMGDISEVTVAIGGMPIFWKILNLLIIVLPKFTLWKLTTETGVLMLM